MVELVHIRKCAACGGEHDGLTVKEGKATEIKGKKYTIYTFCPTTYRRVYLRSPEPAELKEDADHSQ